MAASDKTLALIPGFTITASYASLYNKKTQHLIKDRLELLKRVLPELSKRLNLPNVTIRICTIKARRTLGQYDMHSRICEIDVFSCATAFDLLTTLCHEMVHAEQDYEGRLKYDPILRNGIVLHTATWNGKKFHDPFPKSYAAYKALPWEVEAFERQDILSAEIRKSLF